MFELLNKDKYGLLFTTEELHLKKIKMFSLFLIFIAFITLYKTFLIYETNSTINESFTSMKTMDKDDNYDFLYFDKNITADVRKDYENMINLQPEIAKSLSENKMRILISEDDIQTSFSKLSKIVKLPLKNRTVGIFVKEYKLILLKHQNPRVMKTKTSSQIDDNSMLAENTKYTALDKIYAEELLNDFEILINKTVLYHEIGHYLDKFSTNKLDYNFKFYKAYLTEKKLLFTRDDKYNISSISEYIAQSTSYYLIYGSVEGKNNLLEPNSTKTSKYIGNLVNEYISKNGGAN